MDFLKQVDNNRKSFNGALQWAHYDNTRKIWYATDGVRIHYTTRNLDVNSAIAFPLHKGATEIDTAKFHPIPVLNSTFNISHAFSVQVQATDLRWALTYITGDEVILTVAHDGVNGILLVESETFKIPISLRSNTRLTPKVYNWRVSVNPNYMRQALRYMTETIYLDYNSEYPKTGIVHIGNHVTGNYAGIMRLSPEHPKLSATEHYEVMQLRPLTPNDNLIQCMIC